MNNPYIITTEETTTVIDFMGGDLTLSDLARIGDTLELKGTILIRNVNPRGSSVDWSETIEILTSEPEPPTP